jgi:hypothetical protein
MSVTDNDRTEKSAIAYYISSAIFWICMVFIVGIMAHCTIKEREIQYDYRKHQDTLKFQAPKEE